MRCPACRTPLVVVERESIEVDWCPACRGIWFDEGELELLGERAGRSLRVADLGGAMAVAGRSRRRCPRCPRKMDRLQLDLEPRPVAIDRCAEHGFWLDAGELGRLMAAAEPLSDSDGALVLEFLGETFAGSVPSPPLEGRR